ncbi:hypothetical protein FBB35_18260 [Nostoc sp. TCL240-02]|nr:hypothetical protein FBB35_18260 [Nostoc sp. TCL240-02]
MAKIVIFNLCLDDVETFCNPLYLVQLDTIFGGVNNVYIKNFSDSVNIGVSGSSTTNEGANSYNFRDNKIYTIDYSRSNYNWLLVLMQL